MTHPLPVTDLLRLGAATLHESGAHALPPVLRPIPGGPAVAGRARTGSGPSGDNYWLHRAIYAAEAGDVIVFAADGVAPHGYWGEVMTHAARARGVAGLVIAGGVRDSAQMADLGFPVFATGLCVVGTTKHGRGGGVDRPITIGGVTVRTGDVVVGDGDGVVVVPAEERSAVLERAARREAEERQVIARLGDGETTLDLFGLEPPGTAEAADPGGEGA